MSARRLSIRTEHDAAEATRTARELGLAAGLTTTDAVALATAVSEVAVNQVRHAGGGTITLEPVAGVKAGVRVDARDGGPGIGDVEAALRDGWSAADSLGLGLPAARRLTDEFSIETAPGAGTRIRMAKWRVSSPAPVDRQRLADWATARPPHGRSGFATLVHRPEGALLFAVVRRPVLAEVRAHGALPPHALVEHAGGRDAAIARFDGRDGRLMWQAPPAAAGALLRPTPEGGLALVGTAPHHGCATVAVLRGDVLVLASFAPGDPPDAGDLAGMAEAVRASGPRGGVVLVARFERGSLERRW